MEGRHGRASVESTLVMAEDNDLGVTLPQGKLMCFEKMNQFSGISKSQLCSASVWACLAWLVVWVGWVKKTRVSQSWYLSNCRSSHLQNWTLHFLLVSEGGGGFCPLIISVVWLCCGWSGSGTSRSGRVCVSWPVDLTSVNPSQLWSSPCILFLNLHYHLCCAKSLDSCLNQVWIMSEFRSVACHAALSMGFCRQEYWSGSPWSPLGESSEPGIKPISLKSPELAGGFFTAVATFEAQYYHLGTLCCLVMGNVTSLFPLWMEWREK